MTSSLAVPGSDVFIDGQNALTDIQDVIFVNVILDGKVIQDLKDLIFESLLRATSRALHDQQN